jgi:preprotein translocase subunit SecG
MTTVVIVVHLMLAIALVGVVLLQKSEGGALGIGGGGMSGFLSGRSTANLLTRTTAILAAAFFATSIALAVMASSQRGAHSIIDQGPLPTAPASSPAPTSPAPNKPAAPGKPAAPAAPSAPLAK